MLALNLIMHSISAEDEELQKNTIESTLTEADEKEAKYELRAVITSVIRDNIARDFKKFTPNSENEKSDENLKQDKSVSNHESDYFTENLQRSILDEIDSDMIENDFQKMISDEFGADVGHTDTDEGEEFD